MCALCAQTPRLLFLSELRFLFERKKTFFFFPMVGLCQQNCYNSFIPKCLHPHHESSYILTRPKMMCSGLFFPLLLLRFVALHSLALCLQHGTQRFSSSVLLKSCFGDNIYNIFIFWLDVTTVACNSSSPPSANRSVSTWPFTTTSSSPGASFTWATPSSTLFRGSTAPSTPTPTTQVLTRTAIRWKGRSESWV